MSARRIDHGWTDVHADDGSLLWRLHEVSVTVGPRGGCQSPRGYAYLYGWRDRAGQLWRTFTLRVFS